MEPEAEPTDLETRISRRRALKGIGAGAAVAWSAPIITSLSTPAFAQTPIGSCDDCNDNFCAECPDEQFSTPCAGDPNCFCSTHPTRGQCECVFFPSGLCEDYAPCAPDNTCAEGFRCVTTCCCTPFCAPNCPGTRAPKGAGRPPTWR
jgi:hypothetical protein